MTETFAYIAGRAAMHKNIIRRNQFSKGIWFPRTESQEKKLSKEDHGIIICR
jgi:hypothetical protein